MKLQYASFFRDDGGVSMTDLFIADGRFVSCRDKGADDGEVLDAKGLLMIPGLVDLHFHGCAGYDFCDGTPESLSAIAEYEASVGVAAICPAVMASPEETLEQTLRTAAAWEMRENGAELVGVNLEGPFLSPEKKGAQDAAWLQKPDAERFRRLQSLANGRIKICGIAPEIEGALDCICAISDEVRVSLAHTAADYGTAEAAFASGAKQVSHLFNAMAPLDHREPGVIGAACDYADMVELITDGVHVHPGAVRLAFRAFGGERIILVSDSMRAAGMPDGSYSLGGQTVQVRGNRAALPDGTIAGSVTNLFDCMRIAVKEMGIPMWLAVRAATINPAKALGISDRYGTLKEGSSASFLLIDRDMEIHAIFLRGKRIR